MQFLNKLTSNHITYWFNNQNVDIHQYPALWIQKVVSRFLNYCEKHNLHMCVIEHKFYEIMCEAMCVMYHAAITNKDWSGPKRKFPKPSDWNESKEQLWTDYIHGRLFTYEFWDSFWDALDEEHWEFAIPSVRGNFQYLLPLYIQRSNDILIDEGILVEQDDGQIVTADDCEPSDDTWFY
jgi:hypothetical protein